MTKEERKNATCVGSAEIRMDDTERRDFLVKAAEKAGFKVECSEAIGVFLSGATTPSYWYIRVYWPEKLDRLEEREARRKLADAWKM